MIGLWSKSIHLSLLACILLSSNLVIAQNLEPRALTNIPLRSNFVIAGYQYSAGNLLFDPSAPIEDANAKVNTMILAYARSLKIAGLSGKIDAILPYGISNWDGVYQGIDTTTFRSGFADLRVRVSVNFIGAPPLKKEDFAGYKPKIISGFSLQIFAPTGQYYPDRLINLGSNRWILKPQWGIAKYFDRLILEFYTGLWIYTDNKSFWGGNYVKTKPLFTFKMHGIWTFKNRTWIAGSVGYGIGSRSYINEVLKDNRISTARFALNYAIPIAPKHTLRITGISAIRFERGADFDAFSLSYQYRW